MYRSLPLAALALAGLALVSPPETGAVGPPAAESDAQKVVYLGERGPVLIELKVRIDGRSFRAANSELMNKLFDYLDADGNGKLSKAEAANAPPPAALSTAFGLYGIRGGRAARPGAGRDGQVTREELAAHYRRAGLAPFQVTYSPRQTNVIRLDRRGEAASAEQLTARLFELLDADKDGKLSSKELQAAPGLLKKLDVDEDEMLTPEELRGEAPTTADGAPVALAFSPDGPAMTPTAGRVLHVVGEGAAGEVALARALIEKYGKAGDKVLAAGKLGLTKEARQALDRDGDGKLSLEELGRFARQRPAVTLTVRLGKRGNDEPLVETTGAAKLSEGVNVEKRSGGVTLVLGTSRLELGGPAPERGPTFARLNTTARFKTLFQNADKDGNGYLDKKEAAAVPPFADTFAAMDRDGDGMVYEKEMLAYIKRMDSLRALAERGCVSVVVTNKGKGLVEILDADGDGRLSVRELRGAHKVLGRLDADKDGQLAAAEVPKQHSGAFELGPAGGNAGLARVVFLANDMGRQTPLPARTKGPVWFRKMDRNRDGDVSRLEFLGTEEQFKAIDADGDGLITADEAERYDKRAKQSRE